MDASIVFLVLGILDRFVFLDGGQWKGIVEPVSLVSWNMRKK